MPTKAVAGCVLPRRVQILGHDFHPAPMRGGLGVYRCERCGCPVHTDPDRNPEREVVRIITAIKLTCGGRP